MSARVGQTLSLDGITIRVLSLHSAHVRCQLSWSPAKHTRHIRDITVPQTQWGQLVDICTPAPRPFAYLTPESA